MLPEDAKARRKEALEKLMEQTQVDEHFHPVNPDDKPVPYTDDVFKEAAIQWLIETDQVPFVLYSNVSSHHRRQPISAFEHPSFQKMIHMASQATRGVKIPNRKQTRDEIIALFKTQMTKLKDRLNVCTFSFTVSSSNPLSQSPYVLGQISLTCDAWQASNVDGYFAVTGHWIEEHSPGRWTLEHALLGFTRMNTAHNGQRLGQALYKICNRLGIVHKVSNSDQISFVYLSFIDWSYNL